MASYKGKRPLRDVDRENSQRYKDAEDDLLKIPDHILLKLTRVELGKANAYIAELEEEKKRRTSYSKVTPLNLAHSFEKEYYELKVKKETLENELARLSSNYKEFILKVCEKNDIDSSLFFLNQNEDAHEASAT